MKAQLWYAVFNDNFSRIADVHIHRIHVEKVLDMESIGIDIVENCGEVHKKHSENAIKVFYVTKKDIES